MYAHKHMTATYLTVWMNTVTSFWIILACMIPLGFSNSTFTVLPSVYMAHHYKDRVEGFLAAKQYQNLFTIIVLICTIYLDDHTFHIVLLVANLACSVLTIALLPSDKQMLADMDK
jgi:hypothetical protein